MPYKEKQVLCMETESEKVNWEEGKIWVQDNPVEKKKLRPSQSLL